MFKNLNLNLNLKNDDSNDESLESIKKEDVKYNTSDFNLCGECVNFVHNEEYCSHFQCRTLSTEISCPHFVNSYTIND